MWCFRLATVFLLVRHGAEAVEKSKTEIFDAPNVRIENANKTILGFYVSKAHDLRLLCVTYLPSSVRLSDNLIVWRYNDEVIAKAGLPAGAYHVEDNELLLKASVDAALLVGKYSCNITWPNYGSALSPPVQVELATLKKFKSDPPAEIRVPIGQTAYLPCHPPESHPAPATIVFIANQSKEITSTNGRYFLTPTGLQITLVEKSDEGTYLCRAINLLSGQSRDSKPISFIVSDDPYPASSATEATAQTFRPSPYLQQRNTVDVRSGHNVTFECVMVSEVGRTTHVRWEKYGSVLPPIERRKHVLGNLLLSNVTKEDEGTYICRVDRTGGQSGKQPAAASAARFIMYYLRVHDALRAKLTIERDAEEDRSVTSGLAYRLTCQTASGLASDLEFCVNGRPLLSQSLNPVRTRFQSGESPTWSFTLTESSLRRGVYQCMVRGREPFDHYTVDSDSLYVESSFQKRKESETDDWAGYTASGMDEPGDPVQVGRATVLSRDRLPKIIIAPENETTIVGSSVTFVCQVTSNTDVVYWLKDGERIFDYDPNEDGDEEEDFDEEVASNRYKRIGTASLNIAITVDQDRGWYTCVAANAYGNWTAKAYLDFERRLVDEDSEGKDALHSADDTNSEEEPKGRGKKKRMRLDAPTVFRYSNTSVHLRWVLTTEQRKANKGIRFFKLQYKKLNREGGKDPEWKTLDQELPSHSHSGTIDGLDPGRKYKFRYAVVYDNNDQGLSRMTAPYEMTVEKKQNGPRMPPALTSVKSISWSAIGLHWDYPSDEPAPVDGFVIMYRRIYYADTTSTFQNETVIGGWTREHVLSHLLPATLYQIKMLAFNAAGRSRESNVVNESTLSTDGTKLPRTFDAAGAVDRLFSNRPSVDSNREDVDGASSPPISANRAGKSGLLAMFDMSLATLFYIIGGVVGASLIICGVVVTVRRRQQKSIVKASKGKYRDASKNIYKEQVLCNEPSVMKEMYPPLSSSASFQQSTAESCEDEQDHNRCPPGAASSQGTMSRSNGHIPPPPSLTGFANGSVRPGLIMNLYTNPMDCNDSLEEGRPERRYGLLNKTTTEFGDGEETDGLLSTEQRLAENYGLDCDMNKNDIRYGNFCLGSSLTAPLNGQPGVAYRRAVPPPLILTSASALTSTGPFGDSLNHSFLSSSPHASLASNYSSSNAGDAQSSSTNGGANRTPLLPPPLFAQQAFNERSCDGAGEKRNRIPTPVPSSHPHKTTPSLKSSDSSKAEKRRQRLDTASTRHGGLNGAASPMSVSSHASIGSGSTNGSRPNFSTFKPDPNRQEQNRHNSRNNFLLYRHRLSDGYCSDT